MPHVFIPPAMRALTAGLSVVEADGATVAQLIDEVERRYPGVRERLCTGSMLRPGLAVTIDGCVAALGLMQRVAANAEVHFLPALGGG